MQTPTDAPPQPHAGACDLAFVLLLLQAGIALVTLLGMVVVAAVLGSLAAVGGLVLLALTKVMLLLVLAAGVAGMRPWARAVAIAFEIAALIGGMLNLAVGLVPQIDAGMGFLALLTNLVLPLTVLILLLSPSARRAVCRRPAARAAVVHPAPARPRATVPGAWAERFMRGVAAAPLVVRVTAVLLLISATVHLALVPAHAGEAPGMAWLLALNGLAFAALACAAFTVRWWWRAAAPLLVITVGAYLRYVGSGREAADDLGIATKLVELAALGLVLLPRPATGRPWPRRLRWLSVPVSMLTLTLLTGTVTWAASARAHATDGLEARLDAAGVPHQHHHGVRPQPGMLMHPASPLPPTPQQQAAAQQLLANTRAGIARYADQAAARADGYRPSSLAGGRIMHWENKQFTKDGRVLDPTRPENLVYADTGRGPVLLGALYVMPRAGMAGPEVGGSLTRWHAHQVCVALTPPAIAGLVSPFGACPAGSLSVVTAEMMHVWTVADYPGDPFDPEPDKDFLNRLLAE